MITADAIERMIELTGQAAGSVRLIARHLRDDPDGGLWPKGKRGGGRFAAHVGPSDLANLLLGVLAADTIAGAGHVVRRLRALQAAAIEAEAPISLPHLATLGDALDHIVQTHTAGQKSFVFDTFSIRRHGQFESAELSYGHRIPRLGWTWTFVPTAQLLPPLEPPATAVAFSASAPAALFKAMGELVRN